MSSQGSISPRSPRGSTTKPTALKRHQSAKLIQNAHRRKTGNSPRSAGLEGSLEEQDDRRVTEMMNASTMEEDVALANLRQKAARTLQRAERGRSRRAHEALEQANAATTLAAARRGAKQRQHITTQKEAATKVQSIRRGVADRARTAQILSPPTTRLDTHNVLTKGDLPHLDAFCVRARGYRHFSIVRDVIHGAVPLLQMLGRHEAAAVLLSGAGVGWPKDRREAAQSATMCDIPLTPNASRAPDHVRPCGICGPHGV